MDNYTFTSKEIFENWNVNHSQHYSNDPYFLEDCVIVPKWGVYDNGKTSNTFCITKNEWSFEA